ncbi:MAG: hypothetical protein ABIH99_03210 [Candidatus Micrarchaeota archaeon]
MAYKELEEKKKKERLQENPQAQQTPPVAMKAVPKKGSRKEENKKAAFSSDFKEQKALNDGVIDRAVTPKEQLASELEERGVDTLNTYVQKAVDTWSSLLNAILPSKEARSTFEDNVKRGQGTVEALVSAMASHEREYASMMGPAMYASFNEEAKKTDRYTALMNTLAKNPRANVYGKGYKLSEIINPEKMRVIKEYWANKGKSSNPSMEFMKFANRFDEAKPKNTLVGAVLDSVADAWNAVKDITTGRAEAAEGTLGKQISESISEWWPRKK